MIYLKAETKAKPVRQKLFFLISFCHSSFKKKKKKPLSFTYKQGYIDREYISQSPL